ncbi:MAG TPA: CGNR zinc finger domain-containing protein [Gemmatimonadales bacterium]|nr:CGNR zinc finger domain-containing protein [Gemmatimonadales bacterium]
MTTSDTTDHPPFEWIGGRTSLDFSNTVTWAGAELLNERLGRYGDLVDWAEQADILTEASARRLRRAARENPAGAQAALEDSHTLRKAIHDVVGARADGREPARHAADTLNRFLGRALGRLRLGVEGDACSWVFADEGEELDRMLWPVAWAAASLLTSADAPLVRRCASERCGWLFVDRSRNRSRRWCDMKSCGNSAKARRHYARKSGSDDSR